MYNNYTFKWDLNLKGFKELDFEYYSQEQLKKSSYVELYLSPSISHANCGWDHCIYYVFDNELYKEEYVALYPEKENTNGRFYCVTGNSLGAIAETVWNGVFR